MKKRKCVLMGVASVLSLALLGSGIAVAVVAMSKTTVRYEKGETITVDINDPPDETENSSEKASDLIPESSELSDNNSSGSTGLSSSSASSNNTITLDLAEGYITPQKISQGGYSISAGDYCFELYRSGKTYRTQIKNSSGKAVEEQVAPINIQIKKLADDDDILGNNSQTEMVTGYYQKLQVKKNTIIATASVKSKSGSIFAVTDQYIGSSDRTGFELVRDIKVVSASNEDDGFNSIVKFKEKDAKTHDEYEYFIPALVIKDGSYLTMNAIGYDMGLDYIWAKDTRMGLPMVMTRNKQTGNTFYISRITNEAYTGIDENQGGWLVSKNIRNSSVGISNVDGYVSMDICYPGMEGNVNYLDKGSTFIRRSHPVRDDVIHQYRVAFEPGNSKSYSEAMVASYQSAYEKMTIPKVDANLDKVYDVTLDLFADFTNEYAPDKMGMPFALNMEGEISATDYCMGFVGQQTSVGFHLIRNGIKINSSAQRSKGEKVIDFWVNESFTSYGFPRVWFGTASNVWAGPDIAPSFIRYMSDGMEGILDAYLEEKAAGVTKRAWMDKCVTFADWLVANQNEDGSYYRAYNQNTGKVYDTEDGKQGTSKNNTTCPVRYLIRMYEQTGDTNYLNAAKKAGEFAYQEYYLGGKYYGGTPDGKNVVDKEAGVIALYAFDSLYEATGENKWLNAAEHAATFFASFVYTFDFNVWGKSIYNIYRDRVGTSGLSIISTGGNSVDTFAAYLYYEFFKLYVYTQKEFYYDFALLLQNNTKQFINIDGSLPYGRDGIISEAQNISNQFFFQSVDACLTWCNIAMIDPIASMEDAFGVKSIEKAKTLGTEKLLKKLKEYGSGGNYR